MKAYLKFSLLFSIICCILINNSVFAIGKDSTGTIKYWSQVIKQHKIELNIIIDYATHSRERIKKDIESFYKELQQVNLIDEELNFCLNKYQLGPYQFRMIGREISNLEIYFKNDFKKIQKHYQINVFGLKLLSEQQQAINIILKNKVISANDLDNLKKTEQVINEARKLLEENIALLKKPYVDGNTKIKYLHEYNNAEVKNELKSRLEKYYFSPLFIGVYNSTIWIDPYNLFSELLKESGDTILRKFPGSIVDWSVLILLILVFRFACYSLIFRFFRKFTIESKFNFDNLNKAVKWSLLAVALLLFWNFSSFPQSELPMSFAEVFLLIAQMELGWFFRTYDIENIKGDAPFKELFWIYFIIILFQEFQFNGLILAIILPIVYLIAIYFVYKRITEKRENKVFWGFIETVYILTLILLLIMIVLDLLMYTYLSALIYVIWFIIVVILQLGLGLKKVYTNFIDKFLVKRNEIKIFPILMIGIGIPIIWLTLLYILCVYIAGQFYAVDYLFGLLYYKFKIFNIEFSLRKIIAIIFVFLVFKTFIRVFNASLVKFISSSGRVGHESEDSITTLISYVIWAVFVIIVLYILDVNFMGILLASSGLGLGLGIALKDLFANFISGLRLIMSRIILSGDIVEVNGILGRVIKIKINDTMIQTPDNSFIIFPNSEITKVNLVNWKTFARGVITVGVAYGSDIKLVKELLLAEVEKSERVSKTPIPEVRFKAFGDNALIFELIFKVKNIRYLYEIETEIMYAVEEIFRKNNIVIAYPQIDVHLDYNKQKDNL